ncbi:MAG: peptidase M23, partial [Alloprevotella sp.]|nr:peptidase M23 [Alloprevotella sp.]
MKRSIFLFVILLMATACALPVTAQNSPRVKALQKESTALRRQIAESEQLLRTNRKNVAGQLNNLAVLNDRIATQEKIVEGYRTEVTALGTSIARLQQDLRALETDLAACKDKYRRSVMYLHRNKLLQNKWSFILMSKNFRQMYRRMRYATDYAKYLRVQGEAIRQKEEAVAKAKAQLEADRADKDLMLTEARTQQGELEKQKGERQRMVSQLQSQQKKINAALAQQRKQQATLNARIERLIQEEIAAAERARKERERRERERQERERRERERREAAARAAAKKNAGKSSGSKAAGSKS